MPRLLDPPSRSYRMLNGSRAATRPLPAEPAFLSRAAVADPNNRRPPQSLLLPERFRDFLESVYFEHFQYPSPQEVSRHTVAHGVAPEGKLDLKTATLALLIIEQLVYLLRS